MPSRAPILLEVGQPIPSRGPTKPRHAIKPSKIRDVPAPQVNVLMQVNVLNCHTSDITSVWPHRSPSSPAFHIPSNNRRAARTAAARASSAKAHVEKSLRSRRLARGFFGFSGESAYTLIKNGPLRAGSHRGQGNNQGQTNGNNNHVRGAVRIRPQRAVAQGGYRINHRHRNRVVRLFPLWNGCRAYLWQAILSWFGSVNGDSFILRHLFHWFRRAPDRRRDFWSLRRSYRPESNAHRYAAVHGHRDLPHRLRADLRFNRHLGCGHLDGFADDSGHRRWW